MYSSYRNILPVSIAFIGGMMFAVGQPTAALAITQEYTPIDRSEPKRTQGGGSRLSLMTESISSFVLTSKVGVLGAVISYS